MDEGDPDDASVIAELAAEQGLHLSSALQADIDAADSGRIWTNSYSLAKGFATGSVGNLYETAGAVFSDAFVFGDIRDASYHGSALAMGRDYDGAILSLSLFGLAMSAPGMSVADTGASILKTAVKSAREIPGGGFANEVAKDLAATVDVDAAKRFFSAEGVLRAVKAPSFMEAGDVIASVADVSPLEVDPAAVKAAASAALPIDTGRLSTSAASVFRKDGIVAVQRLTQYLGEIASAGGVKAALTATKEAENIADTAGMAKLAAKSGDRTSGTLRVVGKSAVRYGDLIWSTILTVLAAFGWIAWATWLIARTTGSMIVRIGGRAAT